MRQSTIKALNYANQIRRNQRNQIIIGLRSKLLESSNHSEEEEIIEVAELPIHNTVQLLLADLTLEKVVSILQAVASQHKSTLTQGKTFLEYILTLTDQESFQFKYVRPDNITQHFQITVLQFKSCLSQAPKLIKQRINQININLTRLKNKVLKPENIRKSQDILNKIKQCSHLKDINLCLTSFLQAYYRIVYRNESVQNMKQEPINYGLVEAVTNCLIESTCFKPRLLHATSEEIALLFKAINDSMLEITHTINVQICTCLLQCIKIFREKIQPIPIFSNFLYIIGNALISLSSSFKEPNQYELIYNVVLTKFSNIIRQVQEHIYEINEPNVLEVSSLMVWFIRNEILISEGLLNEGKVAVTNTSQISKTVNETWLRIIFSIFSILQAIFAQKYNINSIINPAETNLINEVLSLLQILYFDFNISKPNLDHIIKNLITFRKLLHLDVSHHEALHQKIFDFYFALVCSHQNEDWMNNLAKEAYSALDNGPCDSNGFKLCGKLLEPESKLAYQCKVDLFVKICNSLGNYISIAHQAEKCEVSINLLSLVYSAMKSEDYLHHRSTLILHLLNEANVRSILELCSKIWQEQKRVQVLIETLQLLKLLSDNQQYSSMIKHMILKVGYYEQLQMLSQNPNEAINRLVYEIYETLEIN